MFSCSLTEFRHILPGRFASHIFEHPIEGSLGIEATIEGNPQEGLLCLCILPDLLLHSLHPILIDKIEKVGAAVLVDELGQLVGGKMKLQGQFVQAQFTVEIGLLLAS